MPDPHNRIPRKLPEGCSHSPDEKSEPPPNWWTPVVGSESHEVSKMADCANANLPNGLRAAGCNLCEAKNRHPEVLAVFGEPRRMLFSVVLCGHPSRRRARARLLRMTGCFVEIIRLICPWQIACPAPFAKIFRFPSRANHLLISRHAVPREGALAVVTDVGMGCGGRGSVVARGDRRAGL